MSHNTTPPPATRQISLYEKHAQTILLGITTAAIVGCFTSLNSLNITVTKVQEQIHERTKDIDKLQNGVNDVRLDQKETKGDIKDVRERVIRLEEQQDRKR